MGKINAASVEVMDGWECVDARDNGGGISHFFFGENDEFAISYNPDTSLGFVDRLLHLMGHDEGGEETALIIHPKGKRPEYLILNGDWRAAYAELVPKGLQVCREFYGRKTEHRATFSDDSPKND